MKTDRPLIAYAGIPDVRTPLEVVEAALALGVTIGWLCADKSYPMTWDKCRAVAAIADHAGVEVWPWLPSGKLFKEYPTPFGECKVVWAEAVGYQAKVHPSIVGLGFDDAHNVRFDDIRPDLSDWREVASSMAWLARRPLRLLAASYGFSAPPGFPYYGYLAAHFDHGTFSDLLVWWMDREVMAVSTTAGFCEQMIDARAWLDDSDRGARITGRHLWAGLYCDNPSSAKDQQTPETLGALLDEAARLHRCGIIHGVALYCPKLWDPNWCRVIREHWTERGET